MLSNSLGITKSVRLFVFAKAYCPNDLSALPFSKLIEDNPLSLNASESIINTFLGIVISSRLLVPLNAEAYIPVSVSGS